MTFKSVLLRSSLLQWLSKEVWKGGEEAREGSKGIDGKTNNNQSEESE